MDDLSDSYMEDEDVQEYEVEAQDEGDPEDGQEDDNDDDQEDDNDDDQEDDNDDGQEDNDEEWAAELSAEDDETEDSSDESSENEEPSTSKETGRRKKKAADGVEMRLRDPNEVLESLIKLGLSSEIVESFLMYDSLQHAYMDLHDLMYDTNTKNVKAHSTRLEKELNRQKKTLTVVEGVEQCKKCKSQRIFTYQMQTRSGDEQTTTYCVCTQCATKWKS